MKIAKGHIVRLEYELKVKGGDVLESSSRSGPLQYIHGDGKMLPGLETVLEGMGVGGKKEGTVAAKDAFGTEESLPTKTLGKKDFPAGEKLEKDRVFEAKGTQGEPLSFKILKIQGDEVTVRLLHPLVGKEIDYKVKVLSIEDPVTKTREVLAPPPPPARALGIDIEEVKE
jgi:FKBP-type peptidyl-prolyl cis-trans isomerase SlyD